MLCNFFCSNAYGYGFENYIRFRFYVSVCKRHMIDQCGDCFSFRPFAFNMRMHFIVNEICVCVCVWQILLITQRSFKLNKYIEITIQSDNEICYVLCCVTLWHGRHKRQRLTSNGTQRNSVARYIQIMRVNFSFRLNGKIWLNRFNHSQKQTTKTKFHAHIFVHLKLESANKHTRSERRQWEFHLI